MGLTSEPDYQCSHSGGGGMAVAGLCACSFVSVHVCLKNTWADYWRSRSRDGSRHLQQWTLWVCTLGGRHHHRVMGNITCPGGQLLGKNMQRHLSQRESSSHTFLILWLRTRSGSFCSNNWGSDCPMTGPEQPESKKETPSNIQCWLWLLQQQSHLLSRE